MSSTLVTGANGPIGSELVEVLRERHGPSQVIRLDLQPPPASNGRSPDAPFEVVDVRDRDALADIIPRHEVDTVYHLASMLSTTGEQHPDRAWDVNLGGLKNVLDLAREHDLQVFWPSSIAVFGPSTPKQNTPQDTVIDPATMYGVTKRSGELLCQYYHRRYDLDVRSLRYPGPRELQNRPRWRHHRLRCRHVHGGRRGTQLYLLLEAWRTAAHDVHARRHSGHARLDERQRCLLVGARQLQYCGI
jgi:nucleoside-diphosphate-sugar epimerase